MKPKASYKTRMSATDETWLIWSNKWGCWYRPKSSGYTSDVTQAGLYSREEALQHYDGPHVAKKYRDAEPFPISAVRAEVRKANVEMINRHRAEVVNMAELMKALEVME